MEFSQAHADVFPAGIALGPCAYLGVGAHADDLELMALYPIMHGQQAGGFTGVVVTDGAGSVRAGAYAGLSDAQMIEQRREEQREAARLGCYAAMVQLGHPSSAAKDSRNTAIVDDLEALLRECKPREVYCHDLADRHNTHVGVLLKLIAAIRRLPMDARPIKLIGCESWRSLGWLSDSDKVLMDVGDDTGLAGRLIQAFDSQLQGKRYDLAALGRRQANATFQEQREGDVTAALSLGMDLTPLVQDNALTPAALFQRLAAGFEREVQDRLKKLGA